MKTVSVAVHKFYFVKKKRNCSKMHRSMLMWQSMIGFLTFTCLLQYSGVTLLHKQHYDSFLTSNFDTQPQIILLSV